jgi:hypothetical protein
MRQARKQGKHHTHVIFISITWDWYNRSVWGCSMKGVSFMGLLFSFPRFIKNFYLFLSLGVASCCASIQLVPCDSVNRNKVSIRHSHFFYFPSLTTCFGPYGPSNVIVYLTWRWPVGAETCSEWRKIKKRGVTYWNFVAIGGITRNQLDRYATGCNTQKIKTWEQAKSKGNNRRMCSKETWVVQWLALGKVPNTVGVSFPSPEGWNKSSFQNFDFSSF